VRRRLLFLVLAIVATAVVLGFVFAGSPTTLANGVTIDGIDVGGLETKDARALLEQRSRAVENKPVVFVAGGKPFPIRPVELGVEPDWKAAVTSAQRQGDGFGPLRGFKRLDVKVFGADVSPPTTVLNGALEYKLALIAKQVDRPPRSAAVVRRGLQVVVVPGRKGVVLDRNAAARSIVRELASLERSSARVELPFRVLEPKVRATQLTLAAQRARVALAAPVRLELGPTRWLLSRGRLAHLLELPTNGKTALRIGGAEAQRWLVQLGKRVEKPPRDATFSVNGSRVSVVPARPGTHLDAVATTEAVLAAALKRRPALRIVQLPVVEQPAKLSTEAARAMHITRQVSTYTTEYGGIANRIHNVQLVAHLVDGKLIAPGATFSFNKTTGERNAAKGFLEAPVIVNGELTTGLGGGVCQVSTTVFNAAFEAGLKITERTNHALYISHYPQGRDATVDYPSVDLKFVNDTGHWLLLRTFVGSSVLTVGLYGTPVHRKVTSQTSPLVSHGAPPLEKTVDASLKSGEVVVDDFGVPAMSTSVTRDVYTAGGKLLYHDTWYSSYRAEPKIVRVGPPPAKKKKEPPATTTTTSTTETTTAPTTTTPSTTTAPTLPGQ
jgi:vancomycin resistance protein YoaR